MGEGRRGGHMEGGGGDGDMCPDVCMYMCTGMCTLVMVYDACKAAVFAVLKSALALVAGQHFAQVCLEL